MISSQREALILDLLKQRGVISVSEIVSHCNCSAMSARRDLRGLEERGLLKRTHGGAIPVTPIARNNNGASVSAAGDGVLQARNQMVDRADALIVTPWVSPLIGVLVERARRAGVPIISESMKYQGASTYVAIDDYAAGVELGRCAARQAGRRNGSPVRVLDVTSALPNCVLRSRGFADGLRGELGADCHLIRVDGKGLRHIAREVVLNALQLNPEIDIVFGINDDMALATLDVCRTANVDTSRLVLVSFGLEGRATLDLLRQDGPYRAGVAMFPELVGRACIDAAACAYHGCDLPDRIAMPFAVLTRANVDDYYEQGPTGAWSLRPGVMERLIAGSPSLATLDPCGGRPRPGRLGFLEVFSSHEWYQNVERAMSERARSLDIRLEVIDASQDLEREIDHLASRIGHAAASLVQAGDTIILDAGKATSCLAEALSGWTNITVITNSLDVIDNLADAPGIRLLASGGTVRGTTRSLVGHNAEATFADLRANKAFVTCSGLTIDFGLSNISTTDLGVKQAMLRAAREVIVLADHTKIGSDSLVKVAPVEWVHRVVTDAGISEHDRLALTQRGIEVTIAET